MSLILEALKKSETRRRLGEAPDIGTPFTVKARRRNPWPLIVILIAVAAGIVWWYVRTMPRPTDASTSVSLPSPPPTPPATGKSPANAQQTGAQVARAGPTLAAREAAAAQAQRKQDGPVPVAGLAPTNPPARVEGNTAGATPAGSLPEAQGLRLINRHLPVPAAPAAAPATANPNTPAVPAGTAQPPISRAATTPAPASAAPARPSAEPGNALPAPQANVPKAEPEAALAKPADVAPAVPTAAAPAVPAYYELAYAVRKDIPQFNLSMHVFTADPATRFVVVDGERKAEGDAVKEGLVLHEVRTDGIILEFRGQRFFYPRPGH